MARKMISFSVSDPYHRRIKESASLLGLTVADYMREAGNHFANCDEAARDRVIEEDLAGLQAAGAISLVGEKKEALVADEEGSPMTNDGGTEGRLTALLDIIAYHSEGKLVAAVERIAAALEASHEAERFLAASLTGEGGESAGASVEVPVVASPLGGGRMAGVVPLGSLRVDGTLDVLTDGDGIASIMWSRTDGTRVRWVAGATPE